MAKSETITTRAPGAGKKTPAKKAPHSRKATSKKKPRKTETPEEPYPRWAAPTPAAAVEAVARLAAVHGLPSPPARKSILDSLVRTILSQNTTDKTSAVAFARLKEGLPTWSSVLDAPEGVAEELEALEFVAPSESTAFREQQKSERVPRPAKIVPPDLRAHW